MSKTDQLKKCLLHNKFLTLLNICLIFILFLPYSQTYTGGPNESDEITWKWNYVYQNSDLLLFYFPLLFSSIALQIIRFNAWRKVLLGVVVFQCFIYALLTLIMIGIPSPDHSAGWGQFILLASGFLAIMILITELKNFNLKTRGDN